jgi:UDP-N-acetylmuramate--alanine ligase
MKVQVDDKALEALSKPNGKRFFLIGIKGTGMAALAEILAAKGAIIRGSDVADEFYTDALLAAAGMKDISLFGSIDFGSYVPDLVIHSAAYSPQTNPDLAAAVKSRLMAINYTQALGLLSRFSDSSAISGVHGKTTTTAIAGTIADRLELDFTAIVGSAVGSFGGRATLVRGERLLIAETCEYRRHFMDFEADRIVITSVESDHQDYYPTYESIRDAFVEFARTLPIGGELIYCVDDSGAREVIEILRNERDDIHYLPYGETADGAYRLIGYQAQNGVATFRLGDHPQIFALHVPGKHIALDAVAAIALCRALAPSLTIDEFYQSCAQALAYFVGSRRRSEIVARVGSLLIMDDYAHHPTAIRETIAGLRDFYAGRRLIVDFMPHTYSRTKALFEEFSHCFDAADLVILHKIYASARETVDPDIDGRKVFEAVRARKSETRYWDEPMEALDFLDGELTTNDLFITMGAGDNWKLGQALADRLLKRIRQ